MSKIVRFHLLNEEFIVFKADLEKYPDCLLSQVVNKKIEHEKFYEEDDIYYINANPTYFKYIVAYMRSELYIEDVKDFNIKIIDGLYDDASFYNFPYLVETLKEFKLETMSDDTNEHINVIKNFISTVLPLVSDYPIIQDITVITNEYLSNLENIDKISNNNFLKIISEIISLYQNMHINKSQTEDQLIYDIIDDSNDDDMNDKVSTEEMKEGLSNFSSSAYIDVHKEKTDEIKQSNIMSVEQQVENISKQIKNMDIINEDFYIKKSVVDQIWDTNSSESEIDDNACKSSPFC